MAKLLIVDDNPDVLDALELFLSLHQHQVVLASNPKDALLAVQRQRIDLVIQDMNFSQDLTSGSEGKSLFHQLKKESPDLPIILMTAWTELETAISLVKQGAADYLPKPWDDQKLLHLVDEYTQNAKPLSQASITQSERQLIYRSQVMHNLIAQANKVADSDINVLVTGANGCGKEVLVDYVHQHSLRAAAPLVKVNIGAIPAELMEAEIFGAEKGAFTSANTQRIGRFEAADRGTLFLDEIGNLPLAGQMKLLRVLQTGEFERLGSNQTQKCDVRVICATNADLQAMVKEGSFREDLLFRLNIIELHLPSLNQRKDDIEPLVRYFIGEAFEIGTDTLNFLRSQPWPGNVRELQNACERAKVFASGNLLKPDDFSSSSSSHWVTVDEKSRIEEVLGKHQWVIKYAAEELGLSRQALYRRIEKYQIKEPE